MQIHSRGLRQIALFLLGILLGSCAFIDSPDQYRIYIRRVYLLLHRYRKDPAEASRRLQRFMDENGEKLASLKEKLKGLDPEKAMRAYGELSKAFRDVHDLVQRHDGLQTEETIKRIVREIMP